MGACRAGTAGAAVRQGPDIHAHPRRAPVRPVHDRCARRAGRRVRDRFRHGAVHPGNGQRPGDRTAGHGTRDHERRAGLDEQCASAGPRHDLRDPLDHARIAPARGDSGHEPRRRQSRRGLPERVPRAIQELAHGAVAHAELRGDLVVAPPLHRLQHDRVTLALRQVLDGGDHAPQPLAQFEDLRRRFHAVDLLAHLLVVEAGLPEQVQGRVVGDAVEPRAEVELGIACVDRSVRAEEGLLHGILRACRREDPRAVAEQRPAVAVHDRLEGALVAVAGQVDEPRIRLGSQQCGARVAGGLDEALRGHAVRRRVWHYVPPGRAVRQTRKSGGRH